MNTSMTDARAKTILRKHSLAAIALETSAPNLMTEMRPSMIEIQSAVLDSAVTPMKSRAIEADETFKPLDSHALLELCFKLAIESEEELRLDPEPNACAI